MNDKIIKYIKEKGYGETPGFAAFKDELVDTVNSNLGDLHATSGSEESIMNTGFTNEQLIVGERIKTTPNIMAAIASKIITQFANCYDRKGYISVVDREEGKPFPPSVMVKLHYTTNVETFNESVVIMTNAKLASLPKVVDTTDKTVKEFVYRTRLKANEYDKCQTQEDKTRLFQALVTELYELGNDERYINAEFEWASGYTDPGSPNNPNFMFKIKYYG